MKKNVLGLSLLTLMACNSGGGGGANGSSSEPPLVDADGVCTQHYIDITRHFVAASQAIVQDTSLSVDEVFRKQHELCATHLAKTKDIKCVAVNKDTGATETGLQNNAISVCADVDSAIDRRREDEQIKKDQAAKTSALNARLSPLGCSVTLDNNGNHYYITCQKSRTYDEAKQKYNILFELTKSHVYLTTNIDEVAADIATFAKPLQESLQKIYGSEILPPLTGEEAGVAGRPVFVDGLLKLDAIAKEFKVKKQKKYTLIIDREFYRVKAKTGGIDTIDATASQEKIAEFLVSAGYLLEDE